MNFPIDALKKRMCGQSRVPKGELWLGTELFLHDGLEDTPDNHFRLAERLGHSVVCLSVADDPGGKPDLGYRYFGVGDLKKGIKTRECPLFVVVDGPFQEMVNQMGLMDILNRWMGDRDELWAAYRAEAEKTLQLVKRLLELPVAALVIADDLSSDSGPLVCPSDIDTLCRPFYRAVAKEAACRKVSLLLHCCGKLGPLLPLFQAWQVKGFAAVQRQPNDFQGMYDQFDSGILIMGGIDAELLEADSLSAEALSNLRGLGIARRDSCDLILASSCGLYRRQHLERIRQIYAMVDS